MKLTITKLHVNNTKKKSSKQTCEERLEIVEQLRLESGKFLYEYPARLRRIIKVIRTK